MIDTLTHTRVPLAVWMAERHPTLRTWPAGNLLSWLDWYWKRGLIGLATARGTLQAVGMCRCVHQVEQARDAYTHHEDGQIVWLELQICKGGHVRQALWHALLNRLGRRKWMAYGRAHRGQDRIWVHPFDQFIERTS